MGTQLFDHGVLGQGGAIGTGGSTSLGIAEEAIGELCG
jgi:hypothetical protein